MIIMVVASRKWISIFYILYDNNNNNNNIFIPLHHYWYIGYITI